MKTNIGNGNRLEYEWERQFDALNHHAIVSIADSKGIITYVNDLFCEISGYTRDELIGNSHRVVKSSKHPPEFYKNMWQTIVTGNIWKGEICNSRKDGSNYWVESTITPYLDENGKPYQYVSIRTDITHVKNAQNKTEESNAILEELANLARSLITCTTDDLSSHILQAFENFSSYIGFDLACVVKYVQGDEVICEYLWDRDKDRAVFGGILFNEVNKHKKNSIFFDGKSLILVNNIFYFFQPMITSDGIDRSLVFQMHSSNVSHVSLFEKQILLLADIIGNAISKAAAVQELYVVKERLRQGQVFANIGTWEWNIDSGSLYWSEKVAPLFGYEEGEVETSYENFIAAVHPDDRNKVKNAIYNAINSGSIYEVEHRIIRRDGSISWVSEKGDVIYDENNIPTRMIGVVQNIDARKSAQFELEKREADLRRAQKLAHLGNWKIEFASGKIICSEEIYKIFGLEPYSCEPTIDFFHSCLHPDDFNRVREKEEESQNTGQYEVEHRIVRPDGEIRWVHEIAKTVLDENGNFYQMSGTIQDITDRVNALKKIREVEERFAFAVEGAGDGIWDWNITTGEMVYDRLYMEMLGYEQNEFPHRIETWIESVHLDDLYNAETTLEKYLKEEIDIYRIELRLKCKSGEYKWILCRGAVVEKDGQGKPVRMIGIHSDIDDFKNIQHELIKAKEEADQANQAKSQFLSSMSHELRTPLNSILGFSQLLKLESDSLGNNIDCIDEILNSGKYLLNLINDILDLSKIESGRLFLSIEPVDLKQVVIDSISVVKPLAQDKVVVEFNQTAEMIVSADITRLRQSIINLLSNAIKYNKKNGLVIITIDDSDDNILLNVKDTGVGISKRNLKKVFEPFDRLNHESSGIEGTGIGLSITKRLMEMMGGNITVDSVLGEGSIFTLSIPKADYIINRFDDSGEIEVDRFKSSELVENKLILYIDDNPSNLRLVRNILKRLTGFELIDADSPEIGIELAKREYPDIIILDINMPNMSGYEVLGALKQNEILKYIPVIALTANAMPKDVNKGLSGGFDDYITKPLDVDAFIQSLLNLSNKDIICL